jgi:hypothetical protein
MTITAIASPVSVAHCLWDFSKAASHVDAAYRLDYKAAQVGYNEYANDY